MVEEHGPDVVEMTVQGEKTPSSLIRPDLDLVVVAAGGKEGLGFVEVHRTNRTIMFFETIDQSTHTVVPELNGRGMEGDEDPWSMVRLDIL